MTTTPEPTRNQGFIPIDPSITDAVGASIIIFVDSDGRVWPHFQTGDLEHLPGDELREEIATIIKAAFEIANTPGFTE